MSKTETLLPEDLDVQVKNESNVILCNISFCEISNETKLLENGETYLERALGFLIIGIIGVVANTFVILVLGSSAKIRQKLINTVIIHQSFVDLLASVGLIGTAHIDGLDPHGLDGTHAEIYCFFLMGKWPLWVMMGISSFNLIFLNIERYISIVHPIYHHTKITRKKVLKLLPVIWIFTLIEISCFDGAENGVCDFGSIEILHIMVTIFLTLHFFLPVMLVLFLYSHMFLRLKGAVNSGSDNTSIKRNDMMEKAKTNIFKTMLFITICYAICYVFNCVYLILVEIGILEHLSGE